jgi:hypothetical protein
MSSFVRWNLFFTTRSVPFNGRMMTHSREFLVNDLDPHLP